MQDANLNYHDWNPPLPLEGVPLQPWPNDTFPQPFETFVRELARSTETPVELAAMMTLAAVATAAQKQYVVQIKDDYNEPVNLWPLIILPPASRKSRVYSEVTAPLRQWESEQKEIIEPLMQSAMSRRKTMEARLKELRVSAAKAEEDKYPALQANIEFLEKELCEIPTCPQIWTGDVTPEHLATIMATNEEAMAVLSDEGGIFDILSGLYSDGRANIDLFLQSHSACPVRVDRGSRPPIFLQRPVLTMGLAIQPQVIRNICRNKTFRGRGLLGRFLYAIPKSNIGKRTFNEKPMNKEWANLYRDALEAILAHQSNIIDGVKTQHSLSMSPEAYEHWLNYAKVVETFMGEDVGYLTHISDWAGKLPGAIARIAGLLHIMRHAQGCPWQYSISLEEMTCAVKIGHVLTNHALVVFDLIQQEGAMQTARIIRHWIIEKKLILFTRRECTRKCRRVDKDELKTALEILEEHEVIREREPISMTSGRKSIIYEVNPHLLKE